jgi:crotonobetainyl-CoA:carnitine CoA-transferase CaiB-like acyl-CoA transferase
MTAPNGERVADGLRIVEIGSSASVAMAGMVMADAGAEVVLVEAPGGSPLREQAAFPMWSRGKQSLVADLSGAAGRERVASLVADADVVLVGLKPASAQRFGLDYEALAANNPRLVHVALSAFGSKGPCTDVPYYDGTMEAKAGRMWEFGVLHGGERPGFAASPVLAHTAAMLILQGAFGALHERLRTGRGQRIETSLAQAYSVHDLIRWPPGGSMDLRTEDIPFIPYTVARTRDGVWLQFAQNGPALFNDFLAALGLAGLGDYGEVMQPQDPENTRGVRARILERIGERTWEEWQEVFENERNVSAELFWAPGEALDHPQFQAMGDVLEIDDPEVGRTRQLGPIVEWQSLPSRPSGPAPSLGSLGDAGFQMPRLDDGPASPAAPQPGVLAGVTVVEFATWIATPFAASLLVDLGARVIKVEPLAGDPMRSTGPALALKMMQGKESLCLDLKAPEAKEVVHRLVARADAMLHSYRPGVPERLGLDFDTLRAINPRLVHLYNGSYGSRGPKAFAAAFHVTGGAVAGGCFAQAGEGVPPPPDQPLDAEETARVARHLELANEANPDFNSAAVAAAALCMGLYASAKRGEALALETRMMLSNAHMMSAWFVDSQKAKPPLPDADLNGQSPLYRLYPASEGWVFLSTPMQRDFERLCAALGAPEIAEAFGDESVRHEKPAALVAALEAVFRTHAADRWERELTGQGVSCVRADIGPFARWGLDEAWVREAGLVCDVEASELGAYPRYGAEVTTERPVELRGGFPAGQEIHAILSELGYSSDEVNALLASGVVAATG